MSIPATEIIKTRKNKIICQSHIRKHLKLFLEYCNVTSFKKLEEDICVSNLDIKLTHLKTRLQQLPVLAGNIPDVFCSYLDMIFISVYSLHSLINFTLVINRIT